MSLHRCFVCVSSLHDNASKKTDELYTRNIDGVDQLVCEFHRGNHEKRTENGEAIIPDVPKTV